ncbi:MAG: hypothetical protein IID45_14685, partial [Planctomycetes bacterium]|nr:hypothetical protein [Planctomycetota bacterium]
LHVLIAGVVLAPVWKFAAVFAVATALSLLTYEYCVRRTWVGTLLNGRRDVRRESTPPETDAAILPFVRPANRESTSLRRGAA